MSPALPDDGNAWVELIVYVPVWNVTSGVQHVDRKTFTIYRRSINTQLTVEESSHRLARAIFHGRRGQIYQRYRESPLYPVPSEMDVGIGAHSKLLTSRWMQ